MGPSLSGRVRMASAPFVRSGITDCSPRFIARTALTVLSLKNGRAVARRTHSARNLMRYFTQRWLPFHSHFAVFLRHKFRLFKKLQYQNIMVFENQRCPFWRLDNCHRSLREILKRASSLFSLFLSLCTFHRHKITEKKREREKKIVP